MGNNNSSIEVYHFFTNINSGGKSSGIKLYREYMHKYTTLVEDMYIFDCNKLKADGYKINVDEIKVKAEQMDWYALGLINMGIHAFHEILNNLNNKT